MSKNSPWCPCEEHAPLLHNLITSVQALDLHAKVENQGGAPIWAKREHLALERMGHMYVRAVIAHFKREESL